MLDRCHICMMSQAKYSNSKSTCSVLPFEFRPKPSKELGKPGRVPSLISKQSCGKLCSIAPSSERYQTIDTLTAFPTIASSSALSHLYWITSVHLMPCGPANLFMTRSCNRVRVIARSRCTALSCFPLSPLSSTR